MPAPIGVTECALADIEPLRARYRQEMNCQIIHDSIHTRRGWSIEYLLTLDHTPIGYASVAIAGPWKNKPTYYEFYLIPELRFRAFEFFEAFLATAAPTHFEVQTNDPLSTVMAQTYGRNFDVESILFADQIKTQLKIENGNLRQVTPNHEIQEAIQERAGGGEWILEIDGQEAGKGGILFHYNVPYGDIYMEIAEPYRRRGLGAYLVQQLKRKACELNATPAARCNNNNRASRRTLQKAGFVPVAHILIGSVSKVS
jgi:GNAT superfamily N-acetyltransferase